MTKLFILAAREYIASVRTKGFIIGLVLAPIFMGGSLIAFALLKDRVDVTDKRVVIIDHSGRIAAAVTAAAEQRNAHELLDQESSKKIKPAYHFEIVKAQADRDVQRVELSDQIRQGHLYAFVEIGARVVHPTEDRDASTIAFYAQNPAIDDLRNWITWPINNQLRKVRLEDAGIDEAQIPDLFTWVNVDGMGLFSRNQATGSVNDALRVNEVEAILVPIVMMMLMLMMMMMSVPGMLQSVMEEKTQRIAEVLLGSVRPFQFMLGKLIGGIAVSFTTAAIYLIGSILLVRHLGLERYIPYDVLPWFIVYMTLAIIMFGALSSALGAVCSEAKDAQSLTFPVIMPILLPMFVYFPVVREPLSPFATWLSMFPLFTPLLMTLRLATPALIPLWQPLVGLIGVLLFTVFFVWTGGRLFRVAILMQGTPPKLGNIIRWALRG
ncbi:MAG: ABC transporter permease [Calditrichaeota bacterium]|nr:MAG: ABC transporter permease [Calditrichota bacterium]